MTHSYVLDSSVTMTWLFKDETTPQTTELLQRLDLHPAVVPALWQIELANVMILAERKGRITATETANFIADLTSLAIEIDLETSARIFSDILPLCRTHHLTSYDAIYLELALRRRLPLATLDTALAKAARKLNIPLLGR